MPWQRWQAPFELCLEATIVTLSKWFAESARAEKIAAGEGDEWQRTTVMRLASLAAANALLALYFCNPLMFMANRWCGHHNHPATSNAVESMETRCCAPSKLL